MTCYKHIAFFVTIVAATKLILCKECSFGDWTSWSACNATCELGQQIRSRHYRCLREMITRSFVQAKQCSSKCSKLSPTFGKTKLTVKTATAKKIVDYKKRKRPTRIRRNANTDCHKMSPKDYHFLLDSSSSVRELNFNKMKAFVIKFVKAFLIGANQVHVGVTTFASTVDLRFYMNRYQTKDSLINAINNIKYRGGLTETALGLQTIRENVFNSTNGDRTTAPDVLIVITDGQSENTTATLQEAYRLQKINVTIYVIGIGSTIDRTETKIMASSPDHEFIINDFGMLLPLVANITQMECNPMPQPTKPLFSHTITKNQLNLQCGNLPCHHGTCVPLTSGYKCVCEPGYTGQTCIIDEDDCKNEPCHYGRCIDSVNGYSCECSMFYQGKRCTRTTLWGIILATVSILSTLLLFGCVLWLIPLCNRKKRKEKENRVRPLPIKKKIKPIV